MDMNILAPVVSLRDIGQFAAALKTLDTIRTNGDERRSADILRAELLERTGDYPQSRALTETLLRKVGLSGPERSTCELVLARLELELGHVDEGISRLQRAISAASECHDFARLCWAELRLLLVVSDRSGPDSVTPLLAELRTHVMQSGDPGIMAALHIYLAETEAKRGLLRNARRHLHIGRRGLSGFSNRWLEALAENVESAIETMASDFAAALTHAWKCLELARDAGAASVQESALGNLGNLSLVASRFDDANDCLNRARAARRGSDNWTACMETSARIYLAQGQLSDCARILDEIDNAVAPSNQSQYVYRHTQLTRVHLLGRMNQVDEALRHSDFVLKLAELSGDHLLSDLTVLTKAELLQESNRTADSVSLLQSLVSALPSRSPDFFAQYERVLACATLRAGHPELAEQHRKRSSRVYLGLRHEAGQLELSRGWTKAGGPQAGSRGSSECNARAQYRESRRWAILPPSCSMLVDPNWWLAKSWRSWRQLTV